MSQWGSDTDANKLKKSYIKGFLDISGGNLVAQNSSIITIMSNSANVPGLQMKPDRFSVYTGTSTVDISYSTFAGLNILGVSYEQSTAELISRTKYLSSATGPNVMLIGNSTVPSDLQVYGNLSFNNGSGVISNSSVSSTMTYAYGTTTGTINIATEQTGGTLNIGTGVRTAPINIGTGATTSGNVNILTGTGTTGKLIVGGDVSLNGKLSVAGDVSFNGNVSLLYYYTKTAIDSSINAGYYNKTAVDLSHSLAFYTKTVIDNSVNTNYYNKTQSDASINTNFYNKTAVDLSHSLAFYTKTVIDNSVNTNYYNKTAVDLSHSLAFYTKTVIDNSVNTNYYNKTQSDGNYYTKIYIDASFGSVYTKTVIDTSVNTNFYNKTQSDASINTNFYNKTAVDLSHSLAFYTKTVIDNSINTNYYNKTQSDGNYYIKTYIDASFGSVYTKTVIDTSVNTNFYNKTQSDASINTNFYNKTAVDLSHSLAFYTKTVIDNSINTNYYNKSVLDASLTNIVSSGGKVSILVDASLNGNVSTNKIVCTQIEPVNPAINGALVIGSTLTNSGSASVKIGTTANTYVDIANYTMTGTTLRANGQTIIINDSSNVGNPMFIGNTQTSGAINIGTGTNTGGVNILTGAGATGKLVVGTDISMNNGKLSISEATGTRISSTNIAVGTITLAHRDASGASSILFKSKNNSGAVNTSDYAYIQYEENVGGTTNPAEMGLLTIGIENDGDGIYKDRISLYASGGSGFVGVNTKDPSYNLDVSGQLRATGGIVGYYTSTDIDASINTGFYNKTQSDANYYTKTVIDASLTGFTSASGNVNITPATAFNVTAPASYINGNLDIGTGANLVAINKDVSAGYHLDVSGNLRVSKTIYTNSVDSVDLTAISYLYASSSRTGNIQIGSSASGGKVNINGGSGTWSTSGTLTLQSGTPYGFDLAVNQTTGKLQIGTGSRSFSDSGASGSISIGTGSATGATGATSEASGCVINFGTGARTKYSSINIGTGSRDTTSLINIGTGTDVCGNINIGTGTSLTGAHAINIGNTTTTGPDVNFGLWKYSGANGKLEYQGVGCTIGPSGSSGSANFANNTTTGDLNLGYFQTTGNTNIGFSQTTGNVNIGTGTTRFIGGAINIGTGNNNASNVNVLTGASTTGKLIVGGDASFNGNVSLTGIVSGGNVNITPATAFNVSAPASYINGNLDIGTGANLVAINKDVSDGYHLDVSGNLRVSQTATVNTIQSLLSSDVVNIATNQTTGQINIGTGNRTSAGTINIGTSTNSSGNIFIGNSNNQNTLGMFTASGSYFGANSNWVYYTNRNAVGNMVLGYGMTNGSGRLYTEIGQGVVYIATGDRTNVGTANSGSLHIGTGTATGATGATSEASGCVINIGTGTRSLYSAINIGPVGTATSNNSSIYIGTGERNNGSSIFIGTGTRDASSVIHIGSNGLSTGSSPVYVNGLRVQNGAIYTNAGTSYSGNATLNTDIGHLTTTGTIGIGAILTSGTLNIGVSNSRTSTGLINIGTGSDVSGDINIGTGVRNYGNVNILTGTNATGKLVVGGDASFNGNVSVNQRLAISKDISSQYVLDVSGVSQFRGNVDVGGTFTINGVPVSTSGLTGNVQVGTNNGYVTVDKPQFYSDPSLLIYYTFDASVGANGITNFGVGGATYNATLGPNNGNITGVIDTSLFKYGTASLKQDSGNFGAVTTSVPVSSQMSISFWIYKKTTPPSSGTSVWDRIIEFTNNTLYGQATELSTIALDISSSGYIYPVITNAGGTSIINSMQTVPFTPYNICNSTWNLINWTIDGSSSKLYVNGAIVQTDTITSSITGTRNQMLIAYYSTAINRDFSGNIDDFRYYKDKVLSQAEIFQLYNNRYYNLDVCGGMVANGSSLIYEQVGSKASANTGSLVLMHGDASGSSSIMFKSNNDNLEYGYIQYEENAPGSTGYHFGLMTIGIENDAGAGNYTAQADRVSLFPSGGQGYVGINTKTPQYSLDISGQVRVYEGTGTTATATAGSVLLEHSNPGGVSSIVFKSTNNSGSDYAYIQYQETTTVPAGSTEKGLLTIGIENDPSNTASSDRISLYADGGNGYVGVNTKDPAYNLDVSGTINASGLIQGQRFNSTSDYRVKTNVQELDSSFTVDSLRPVRYTFASNGSADIGFIAHEVQEYYPYLVQGTKDGPITQSLNYNGLIGILTKEVKDLKNEVKDLKNEVKDLKTIVAELLRR